VSHICDASTVINLINGGVFCSIIANPTLTFYIGPIVEEECLQHLTEIACAKSKGYLQTLDDSTLPGSLFLDLLEAHDLGAGETECIAFSIHTGFTICCDDRRARQVAEALSPPIRVVGSLGLLRIAVAQGVMSRQDAFAAYQRMITFGGFLPSIDEEAF